MFLVMYFISVINWWIKFQHFNSRFEIWHLFIKFWKSKLDVQNGFKKFWLHRRSLGVLQKRDLAEDTFNFCIWYREAENFQHTRWQLMKRVAVGRILVVVQESCLQQNGLTKSFLTWNKQFFSSCSEFHKAFSEIQSGLPSESFSLEFSNPVFLQRSVRISEALEEKLSQGRQIQDLEKKV